MAGMTWRTEISGADTTEKSVSAGEEIPRQTRFILPKARGRPSIGSFKTPAQFNCSPTYHTATLTCLSNHSDQFTFVLAL